MALSVAIASMVGDVAAKFGLPAYRLQAQVLAESSGNPSARGPFGEIGLMQLSKPLLQDLGLTEAEALDAKTNLNAGAGYLKRLVDQFKGLAPEMPELDRYRISLMGYNGGPGYLSAAIKMLRSQGEDVNLTTIIRTLPYAKVSGRTINVEAVLAYAEKIIGNATMLAGTGTAPAPVQPVAYTPTPAKKPGGQGILLALLAIGAVALILKR